MIPYSRQDITDEDIRAVTRVLKSDFLTQGPIVPAFEEALKQFFSVKHAIVCSSGTAALHLSYASLGVNSQTVGIVPAITFAATANAFRYLGAEVKFCDVDHETGLICPISLEAILHEIKPKPGRCPVLISPVSFAGATAPLCSVEKMSSKFGFQVVEDASHSPGSFNDTGKDHYKSASCIYTDAACLSFHPVKHICCGEGGAVLTNDDKVFNLSKKLRSHGIERPHGESHPTPWLYQQTDLGWNYRMTDLQAALGMSQLERLNLQLNARRRLASIYSQAFSVPPFRDFIDCPPLPPGHSWHLYIIRFKQDGVRDRAHKFLKDNGIMTQVHYIPVYRHPYYRDRYGVMRLPEAEKFYQSCLSIPMFPTLSVEEQSEVIEKIKIFCERL